MLGPRPASKKDGSHFPIEKPEISSRPIRVFQAQFALKTGRTRMDAKTGKRRL
jgi:hypothetical protein